MSEVIVKLKLPAELHNRFKRWVFDHGTTMQRRLVDLVEANNGSPQAVSGSARMSSEVAGKSERDGKMEEIPPEKVNPPISEIYRDVATRTCFKCKTKVEKWTMDSRGKPWCDDCLEDARNAIP